MTGPVPAATPPSQPEPLPKPRKRRRWFRWIAGGLLAILLIAFLALVAIVQSDWFANKVRERAVGEIETASGGRAVIGSFHFDWHTLTASINNFVLHGTEAAGQDPLLTAKQIRIGIGITSILRAGVHVRSIQVDEPAIHLIATEDGKTNLPAPKIKRSEKDFVDTLLDLAANEIVVQHGSFSLNERRIPLDLTAKDLNVRLLYKLNLNKPVYLGDATASSVSLQMLQLGAMTFAFDSSVVLEHGTITVSKATLSTQKSKIEVSGFAYHLLEPSSDFGVSATLAMSEFAPIFHIPLERRGEAKFAGKVSLALKDRFRYELEGRLKAQGFGFGEGAVRVENIGMDSLVNVTPAGLKARRLLVTALGGEFIGSAALANFNKLTLEGVTKNLATARVLVASGQKPLPYVSIASGPLNLQADIGKGGIYNAVLDAELALVAEARETPGQIPLNGLVNVTWSQKEGTIELHDSRLATSATEVNLSGTLGKRVDVTVRTTRLSDIEAMLTNRLPVQLKNGSAAFQGVVIGPLDNPRIEGHATATNLVYDKQTIDSVATDLTVTRDRLDVRTLNAVQGAVKGDGNGSLTLQNWAASAQSPLTAHLNVNGARIETLLTEFNQPLPITGSVTVTANVQGSASALKGDARVSADDLVAWDEHIDRIRATVQVTPDRAEVTDGILTFHKADIPFSGAFLHKPDEWKTGQVSWKIRAQALDAVQINNFKSRLPDWQGTIGLDLSGSGALAGTNFRLTELNGDASVRGLTYEGRMVGTVEAHAASNGVDLKLTASSNMRGARIKMTGDWKLQGSYPGAGELSLSSVSLQTLRDLFSPGAQAPLPFQSAVEATATFEVPLADPNRVTADVKIQRLFIAPGATQKLGAGAQERDLILENVRPILVHVTPGAAVIEKASFHATNTNLEVAGKVAFDQKQAFDLTLKGALNLSQLQMFKQDLLASGDAVIDATVRGSLTDPQVNGSLTLSKASLFLGDLPAGLDNVNGVVSFDRNRATVQSMTGESGGGKVGVAGFIGFGGPALVYRLQGSASGVRVRYPEGASTTVSAALNLTGTSQDSLLAGTVTIMRAAFTPKSDLGALIANFARPGTPSAPQDSDYMRGMQLDVRVESTPNLEFQTSLTRGLQAEVDLRLRGTAARPSLLGNVSFSGGEIALFGNKYTLNRGDIRFFNPTRIEPVFDLEAETRSRGIDVNVSFSGTPSKLNVSYRSDPPLQPSDIIALLAIGRDPNVAAGIASSQITQQSTAAGLGNVVGEALASSVSNRLQKFFGVTKIKIDPQLTGLDNIPQARLTLEQQVSKDITLTYITNLARTQEQIVRIEWGFSHEWSAIAVREENGLFGLDFQYRKRFK